MTQEKNTINHETTIDFGLKKSYLKKLNIITFIGVLACSAMLIFAYNHLGYFPAELSIAFPFLLFFIFIYSAMNYLVVVKIYNDKLRIKLGVLSVATFLKPDEIVDVVLSDKLITIQRTTGKDITLGRGAFEEEDVELMVNEILSLKTRAKDTKQ